MKNEVNLQLTLVFTGKITKKQQKQVAKNVMDSLVHTVDTAGLAPDDAEVITDHIGIAISDSSFEGLYLLRHKFLKENV